jgi:Cu/Ag efflux protein CusF
VGKIQVVDRTQNRIVMEERGLEVWATDRSQLEGLVPGQKVRLRYQQQDGRQVITGISPVVEAPTK